MIIWILSGIDITCLVKNCDHEEFQVPNIEGFVICSTWNKNTNQRGIEGIACYNRKIISPHTQLSNINPPNQYIWIEISYINAKKMYIEIC